MNDELEFFKEQNMKALPPGNPLLPAPPSPTAIPAGKDRPKMVTALEYGRCGLRTFSYDSSRDRFISVSAFGDHWADGTCTVRCLKNNLYGPLSYGWNPESPPAQHEAPDENCSCGIYACLTLENLLGQYMSESMKIVAVIAAQGQTIIGDVGFQTQYARVIAYWLGDVAYHANPMVDYTRTSQRRRQYEMARQMEHTAGIQFRHAKRFHRIDQMLYGYGFPRPTNGFYETFGMMGNHRRYFPHERFPLEISSSGIDAIRRMLGL